MSFQNSSNGFGGKASKNIEKDFSSSANEKISQIKEKGNQIAKENEATLNTAKKVAKNTAIGCSAVTIVSILVIFAVIAFIIIKLFK